MKNQQPKNKRHLPRPGVRSLKIQPKHRFGRWESSIVPELILCGKWLEELGFKEEGRVLVHTSNRMIVIIPDENPEE